MKWFRDLGLGIKLSVILLGFLGIMLISLIALLVFNTQNLTREVANEEMAQELRSLETRLQELETTIENDINFLVADISFIQATGRRSEEDINKIIQRTDLTGAIFDVDVVDGDGNILLNSLSDEDGFETLNILFDALEGGAPTAIIAEETAEGTTINISSARPIQSVTGNVLGAIVISRRLDDSLLKNLSLQSNQVYIGLIYDGQILARNRYQTGLTASDNFLIQNLNIDTIATINAENGEELIVEDLLFSNNIPYKVAYAPINISDTNVPVIFMLLVELSDINAFQTQTLYITIILFVALTLITVLLIYFTLSQLALKPISNLREITQKMVDGDYSQRIPIRAQDELGQLATAFNTMVATIEERESSLKDARGQAERSEQVKSAFLASMSHELRTPLNSVINFTKFVVRGVMGPVTERQEDALNKVIASGQHLLSLINDVLDMSKIESGSLNLFIEDDLDPHQIISTVLANAESLLDDKSVEIKREIQAELPVMTGDRKRITQILLNVVSNACKFTDEGSISLRARIEGANLLIEVEDTGEGIAEEDKEAVFAVFRQTSSGLRQAEGTGLGMPISKNLAEAHGGKLWFESEVDKGTTFFILLPIKSQVKKPRLVES